MSVSDHNSYHSCHQNQLGSGARPHEKLHWQTSNGYSWPYEIAAWNTALSRTRYLSSRPLPRSKATTSTKPCRQVSPIFTGLFHHSRADSETGELINGGRLSAAQLKIFIQMLRQSYIQRPTRARTPPPSPPPPSQSASVPHPDPWSLDPSDELFEEAPSIVPGKLS